MNAEGRVEARGVMNKEIDNSLHVPKLDLGNEGKYGVLNPCFFRKTEAAVYTKDAPSRCNNSSHCVSGG